MYRNYIFCILSLFMAVAGGCSLSQEAQTVWRFRTEQPVAAKPVIADGRVYVCSDRLYCLDATNGKPVWQFNTYGTIPSPVVVKHGNVYFQCGGIYSLNAATGALNWEFWQDAWRRGRLEVTDQHIYSKAEKTLSCVNVRTGKGVWKTEVRYAFAQFAASENFVYIGTNGKLLCLDAYTGKKFWHSILGKDPLYPTLSQDKVYAVSDKGKIFCIDGLNGAVLWQNEIDSNVIIKPIVLQDFVYVGSNEVYCLNAETGRLLWKSNCNAFRITQMQITGELMYFRGLGHLFCLNIQDGEKMWEYTPELNILKFAVHDDLIYAGSTSHVVACLRTPHIIRD